MNIKLKHAFSSFFAFLFTSIALTAFGFGLAIIVEVGNTLPTGKFIMIFTNIPVFLTFLGLLTYLLKRIKANLKILRELHQHALEAKLKYQKQTIDERIAQEQAQIRQKQVYTHANKTQKQLYEKQDADIHNIKQLKQQQNQLHKITNKFTKDGGKN